LPGYAARCYRNNVWSRRSGGSAIREIVDS